MCAPWNRDDPTDLLRIEERLRTLLSQIALEAPNRATPTVSMAQSWHRVIHTGLHIPEPYYAGEVRDRDARFPCLVDYEVRVGAFPGVRAADVPAALHAFERAMQRAAGRLDAVIPAGRAGADTRELWAVIQLCALAHGEWVRIHPFANGNGRTARLWANWCAVRYGLPPFVRLRPRPAHQPYTEAGVQSMQGNHGSMAEVFLDMLLRVQGSQR